VLLWFAEDIGEDPPAKMFVTSNVGVDAEGVSKAPHDDVLAEAMLV
jgi:hypothetical protein